MATELKRRTLLAAMGGTALSTTAVGTGWAKDYGPGVTDTEIKLGTTSPYSGPAIGLRRLRPSTDRLLQHDQRPEAASMAARST